MKQCIRNRPVIPEAGLRRREQRGRRQRRRRAGRRGLPRVRHGRDQLQRVGALDLVTRMNGKIYGQSFREVIGSQTDCS